jgi:hypothetical protein
MLVLACGFVLVQFSRPARTNPVTDETRALEAHVNVSPEVKAILARACDDCHSNRTHWPWYSHVAPVSWTVADHVRHGRRRMNFSDWARYDAREADYLLGDICKTAKQGIMPLNSYTLIHRNAFLSAADVGALCAWTQTARQQLAARGRKQESDARSQKPEGN